MPVVKFPGVTERLIKKLETSPEAYSKELRAILTGEIKLPPRSPEEEAAYVARQEKLDEEFYDEDARDTITDFSVLLSNYRDATIGRYGEDSAEASAVVELIVPIKGKLRQFRDNIYDPNVKEAIKSLREIWTEYKGGYYDEKGELHWRNKPIGPEVVSAFWGTAKFDL